MTAFAVKRTGGFVFSSSFPMTLDAGSMGGLAQGNPVFFGLRPVAIAAGSLLVFGIEKLFGFLVVLVMALFAFFVHGLGMAIVQGFIHADGLPGRDHGGLLLVAFTALERTAFFFGGFGFLVAGDAVVVVNIHHLLPGGVFQPHKFGEHPLFAGLRVVSRQMTGCAIFVFLFKCFGMPLV